MKTIQIKINALTDDILTAIAKENGVSKSDLISAAATIAADSEDHKKLVNFARACRNGKRDWKRKAQ